MTNLQFSSFGNSCSGRLVTSAGGLAVVNSRNPYGSHNLVMVDEESGEAIRHGTESVLAVTFAWMPKKAYRKVRRFLADRGVARDWIIYE